MPYDSSGSSTSGVNDIDDDGNDDFAIGSPDASPYGRTNAGSVAIVYGSNSHNKPLSIDLSNGNYRVTKIYGPYAGDRCGIVINSAGKFNKDNYADIMISCYLSSSNGLPSAGAVYIVYGGKNLSNIDLLYLQRSQGFVVYGANSYDYFGFAIANMNNYLVISSPQASPNEQTNAGIIYLLAYNSTQNNIDLSITPDILTQIYGANAGDFFGSSIGKGGDFAKNGNFYLAAGAPSASDNNKINSGTGYLINMNFNSKILYLKDAVPPQVVRFFGKNDGDFSSYVITSIGDHDNNGNLDLAISSPFADPFGRSQAGSIAIFLEFNLTQNIYLSNSNKIEISGGKAGHNLGKTLKLVGDLNNDGCSDFSYSIPQYSYLSRNKCGITHTLLGALKPISIDMAKFSSNLVLSIVGGNSLDNSGYDFAPIGNFAGNGRTAIVVGIPGASPDSKTKSGSIAIISGGYNTPTSQPTSQPSVHPSNQPSEQPTSQPTKQPSTQPTKQPTSQPSVQPSSQPSKQPTSQPTALPSFMPTKKHSKKPTAQPIIHPTSQPSTKPTGQPSEQPTEQPTKQPILEPTSRPTQQPISKPSSYPSTAPTSPTGQPSISPTMRPSVQPSSNPTSPTSQPTATPTFLAKKNFGFVDLGKLTHYQGITINGKIAHYNLGSSIAWIGDLDGDGYDDFAIGSSQASPQDRLEAGSITIVYGSYGHNTPTSINLANPNYRIIEFYGAYAGDKCGIIVINAGDFNKDGNPDIMISCSFSSANGLINSGAVYVIYGGPDLSNIDLRFLKKSQGFVVYGTNDYDFFGSSIAYVNNYLIMSSSQASPLARTNAGIVYCLAANESQDNLDLSLEGSTNQITQIFGAYAGDFFGFSIAGQSIYNPENKCSYLSISANYASDNNLINSGTTYLICMNFTSKIIDLFNFDITQGIRIFGSSLGGFSGYSIDALDYNGDKKLDLAIGEPKASALGRDEAGIIHILYNLTFSADINLANYNKDIIKIFGEKAGANVGTILKLAGDINNNGKQGLIISMPQISYISRNKCGKIIVVFGTEKPKSIDLLFISSDLGIVFVGGNSLDSAGFAVAGIKNFNGDSRDDLAFTAPKASGSSKTESGSAYVYYSGYNTPTSQPTSQPTVQPALHPTSKPTSQPIVNPTSTPTIQPTILLTVDDNLNSKTASKKNGVAAIAGVSVVGLVIGIAMCVFQSVLYDLAKATTIKLYKMNWKEALKSTPGALYELGRYLVVKAITTNWIEILKSTPNIIYEFGKYAIVKAITTNWIEVIKSTPTILYKFIEDTTIKIITWNNPIKIAPSTPDMDDLTTRLEEGNLDSPKDNSADLRNNNLPQDKTIKAEAIEDNNDLFFPYQSGLFFEDSSRVASIISSSSSIDPLELAIEQIVQRTNSSVATLTIPRSVLETDSNYHEIFYPTLEENSSIESPDTEAYVTDLVGEDPFNSGYSSNSSDSSFFQIY